MVFKACVLTSILKEFKAIFMEINDPTDFIAAFEVICKTYSSFEVLFHKSDASSEFSLPHGLFLE